MPISGVCFFLKTQTKSEKISFSETGGKGANIIKFLDFSVKSDCLYFGMFDSDLKSIEENWLIKMFSELKAGADYVIPSYQRSPFEGSTTNHLCVPIIQAIFAEPIVQPICGDFMFSKRFVILADQYLKKNPTPSNLSYGIDICLTVTALLNNLNISNCDLTKKVHKPSFPKIENMFIEVASSLIGILRNNDISVKKMAEVPLQYFIKNSKFPHKEQAKLLKEKNWNLVKEDEGYYSKILSRESLHKLFSNQNNGEINEKLWSYILFDYLRLSKTTEPIQKLAESLKNLFICRAVTFWEQAENSSVEESAHRLKEQTQLLQTLLEAKNVFIS